jgi:hypothetical protein
MEEVDCVVCLESNTGERTVACEKCNEWVHYGCAKLTREQVDRIINFYCKKCETSECMTEWRKAKPNHQQVAMKARFYYEVAAIRGSKRTQAGRFFQVEWKDCPSKKDRSVNERTWEPESYLDGCIDLVQHYCRVHGLPLSNVNGLLGAGDAQVDKNVANWITMEKLLENFNKIRTWCRLKSNLVASEWSAFGENDQLYFLRHSHHCFVLLHRANQRLAYIADGTNIYRTDQTVADELKELLKVRLISIKFDQQLAVDHCGSSAILIGIELLKAHHRNMEPPRLLVANKTIRDRLIIRLHKADSVSVGQPPLNQRKLRLRCPSCTKSYQPTQGRALALHMIKAHNN